MDFKSSLRFIIILLAFPFQLYSQLSGDWILSHSYAPVNDNKFDFSQKRFERPSIMSFSEDSIISYTFKGFKIQDTHFDYLYSGDTIYFHPAGSERVFFETSLNADSMSLIDYNRKGSYIVLRKIEKHKKTKNIADIENYLKDKTFLVDFSKMISIKHGNPSPPAKSDSVQFSDNGVMIVNSEEKGKWKLFEINDEVYLLLHPLLFQVDSANKKRLTLVSYYFDSKNRFEWNIVRKHGGH